MPFSLSLWVFLSPWSTSFALNYAVCVSSLLISNVLFESWPLHLRRGTYRILWGHWHCERMWLQCLVCSSVVLSPLLYLVGLLRYFVIQFDSSGAFLSITFLLHIAWFWELSNCTLCTEIVRWTLGLPKDIGSPFLTNLFRIFCSYSKEAFGEACTLLWWLHWIFLLWCFVRKFCVFLVGHGTAVVTDEFCYTSTSSARCMQSFNVNIYTSYACFWLVSSSFIPVSQRPGTCISWLFNLTALGSASAPWRCIFLFLFRPWCKQKLFSSIWFASFSLFWDYQRRFALIPYGFLYPHRIC